MRPKRNTHRLVGGPWWASGHVKTTCYVDDSLNDWAGGERLAHARRCRETRGRRLTKIAPTLESKIQEYVVLALRAQIIAINVQRIGQLLSVRDQGGRR